MNQVLEKYELRKTLIFQYKYIAIYIFRITQLQI